MIPLGVLSNSPSDTWEDIPGRLALWRNGDAVSQVSMPSGTFMALSVRSQPDPSGWRYLWDRGSPRSYASRKNSSPYWESGGNIQVYLNQNGRFVVSIAGGGTPFWLGARYSNNEYWFADQPAAFAFYNRILDSNEQDEVLDGLTELAGIV